MLVPASGTPPLSTIPQIFYSSRTDIDQEYEWIGGLYPEFFLKFSA